MGVKTLGADVEAFREGGRGLSCSLEWTVGGEVALTRRPRRAAWGRGTWPLPAAPGTQTCDRVRGARAADGGARLGRPGMPGLKRLGGPDPRAGRASRAGAPGSFVGRSAPRKPWSSPPGLEAAPSQPREPRDPGPSQRPEFPGCFHLQRNFPGPLGCCDSPTNRPKPAPAVRPAPLRPRQANDGLHQRSDWGASFPWGVTMQMKVGAPVCDWLRRPLSRVGGGQGRLRAGGTSSSAALGSSRD